MIKKGVFYFSILLTVAFISLGFKTQNSSNNSESTVVIPEKLFYVFPTQDYIAYLDVKTPYKGKYFISYQEAIAHKESQGRYGKINSLGYVGKYQFGKNTLKSIGVEDKSNFLINHELQEEAFITLLSKNKYELKNYISFFEGKIIGGVKITESGILAAAHLGGTASVKRFLNTNGKRKCRDSYGTSVKSYIRDFGGFETQGIKAVRNAKVD